MFTGCLHRNKLAPSANEVQSAGYELRQHVGVHHHDDSDDGCKRHGVPENEAEDGAFVANLIGRRGSDANRLRIDHLAHNATGAVRAAHEYGAQMELLRGDFLQTTEQRIGRGIAAGQGDAKPADVSAKEGKEPPRACGGQTKDRVQARVSRDETNGQLEAGQSPNKNDERQDGKGHPGPGNLAGGEVLDGIPGFGRADGWFVGKAPDSLGLPDAEKKQRGEQGNDGGDDIHEIAVPVIGPEPLGGRKGSADNEDGGKDLPGFPPTDHGADQPEGNRDSSDGKDAADHGAEVALVKRRDRRERMDGDADRAPGYRSSVGDQDQRSSLKGFEAESDHERAGDGHGRAESRGAFDEGAETESDQENLQAAIGGNGRDRLLHDLELASLDGYVIEEDGGDDNPNDFEETKSRAVEEAGNSQEGWHLKGENGDKDCGCRAGNGTNVRFQAKAGKES